MNISAYDTRANLSVSSISFFPNFRWKLPERSEASLKVSEFNVSCEGKF